MTTKAKPARSYRRLPADPVAASDACPSFSRGWIRFRSPLWHPLELLRFLSRWRRLKRELDASPGLISFEYRVQLKPLMIGMHIAWKTRDAEARFTANSSHDEVAAWASRSPLTPALRLEHFTLGPDRRLLRLGGFFLYELVEDLPADAALSLPELDDPGGTQRQ